MAIDSASPRTRRALLTAALGAGAATVASAIGRPLPARAGSDGDVVLGGTNSTNKTTTMLESDVTHQGDVLAVTTLDGTAIRAFSQVRGAEVHLASGAVAIKATTQSATVIEASTIAGRPAIVASSFAAEGIRATSGLVAVATSVAAGVRGVTDFSNGMGVLGENPSSGDGVRGVSAEGAGVRGKSTWGTAVFGQSANPTLGYALRADGRVRFDRCAGIATIATGKKTVMVTPGINLVSTSAVVATLQGSAGGTTTVHRVSVSATNDTFTIYLTANSTANVKVAWHVFG